MEVYGRIAATYGTHLYANIIIQQQRVRAMIDLGATGNFISYRVLTKLNIKPQKKQFPYPLRLVNGSENAYGDVLYKTPYLHI